MLIRLIIKSKKIVIRCKNKRREHSFTTKVAFLNDSFCVFNLGLIVYYLISNYIRKTKNYPSQVDGLKLAIFFNVVTFVSMMFTMLQFWIDLVFNRLFRKTIRGTLFILTYRRTQVLENSDA